MSYVLGTLIPLVGGGYAAAYEKPGTFAGAASTDLWVQIYDTSSNPVGAAVLVTQASSAAGADEGSIADLALVATPSGGFVVVFDGTTGDPSLPLSQSGALFSAAGVETLLAHTTSGMSTVTGDPIVTALASGGFVVVKAGYATIYDASGKTVMGVDDNNVITPGTSIQVHDFITEIGPFYQTNGVTDVWPVTPNGTLGVSQMVVPVSGGAGQVISGTAGWDSVTGAGSDTFVGGAGDDVISGGGGHNQYNFALDGSVDEVTNFNTAADSLKITGPQGVGLQSAAKGAVIFDARTHGLYWDDDGVAGADKPIAVAMLDGVTKITASNVVGVSPAEIVNVTFGGGYDATGSGQIGGSALADTLTGGSGNDTLTGGGGNDQIDGGAGSNDAVFSGPLASYNVALNPDGSLTVTDLRAGSPDGTDHLSHIQTLVFSNGSESAPAPPVIVPILGPQVADISAFIQETNPSAWVWDPTRGDVDLVTSDGRLYEYHLATQQLTLSMAIGGVPNGADITPDGKYLLVTNKAPPSTGGGVDQITRIDLTALTTQTLQFSAGFNEGGPAAIIVAANGDALVSTTSAGSGDTTLREFNAEAASPSFVIVPSLQQVDHAGFAASEDRQDVLLFDQGDSSGALHIYSSAQDAVIAGYEYGSAFQNGAVAVSAAAQLVANHVLGQTMVFDTALHPIIDLNSAVPNAIGLAFGQGGHELFVQNASGPITIFETETWAQIGTLALPVTGVPQGAAPTGHMQLVDDGRVLLVDYGAAGVQAVDLSAQLTANLTIAARAGGDSVTGYAGADSLLGSSGNDSLSGGAGNDTIDGGGGSNTAFYTGVQSDYAVTHNSDGSLTVTDLRTGGPDGTDRLTNIQSLSFADGAVSTGAATAPPPATSADLTTFVQQNDANAWAWDASRQMIDFVTNDGTVTGYSVPAQQFTFSLKVGGVPGSVDVSLDGDYMVIGNKTPLVTSEPLAFNTTYANEVTRVNLNTLAVDTLQYTAQSEAEGVTSVAIAADGTVLIATGNQFQPVRIFKDSDANPTLQTLISGVYGADFVESSDHQQVLIQESGTTGPLRVFSSGSDTITATTGIFDDYPAGRGGIDTTGKLVVDELNGTTYIFDTSLNPVANLTTLTSGAIGATFTTGGHDLLVWQRSAQQVLIFDAKTWVQVGTLTVPANTVAPLSTSLGKMEVVDGGRLLLLDQGSGVQIIDLAARLTTGLSLTANAGGDSLLGYAGNDTLTGGSGNDTLDGGGGWNTAVFSGKQSDYITVTNGNGQITVGDIRAGRPDGTDTLLHVQSLKFSDGTVTLGPANAADAINIAYSLLLREPVATTSDQTLHDGLETQASAGTLTIAQAVAAVIHQAAATASVATMSYEFFTGSAPSAGGMDFLISAAGSNPNNLNSAYYQSFSTENRYINFAVNLGKLGAGAAAFQTDYGALDLSGALTKAYTAIFGTAPSADKVSHLLNDPVSDGLGGTYARSAYFAAYGGDGANGIGTKAAMVGWLLAEAVISDLGTYAKSNDAFLTDVAEHNAAFGVDIIGHYAQASFAYTGG